MSKREKEEGARNKTNLLGFWEHNASHLNFPHILQIAALNGAPDEVLFLWLRARIPKSLGLHFSLFVFDFKVIGNGTGGNDENLEEGGWGGGHRVRCCLPAFSPSEGALKI